MVQGQDQNNSPCNSDSFCICKNHPVGALLPDCDDCSGYFQCGEDIIQKLKCKPGEIFDIGLTACVPGKCPRSDCSRSAALSGCSSKDEANLDTFCICKDLQVGDLLPDCDDCSGYFQCGEDIIQRLKCNLGEIFDSSLSACVPGQCPRNDCKNTTNPGVPGNPGDPGNPGNPVIPSGCGNKEVKCRFHGQILPHAQHCRFFWTCVEGCPMLGFCELGMWFDREKFVCRYPNNVSNCPINQD